MTVGQRIKLVRKELNLNQTDFGSRIGVSQTTIGLYENDTRPVTDRVIMQLCNEFGISDIWLRAGDGEMFIDNSSTILSQLADEYNLNQRSSALVESFLSLSNEQRDAIVDAVEAAADKIKAASAADQADDWKKQELDAYAKELDAQEKARLVDATISGTEKQA